jgi:purine-binding chemotaxis protein CheW
VIVVRVHTAHGEKTAGIVVDAVSEVYNVTAEQIRATPDLGVSTERACVHGLASVEEKMVMLLDIDKLVASCIEAPELAGTRV